MLTNCYDKYLTNANKASKYKGKHGFYKCYAVQIIMLFVYRLDTEWIQEKKDRKRERKKERSKEIKERVKRQK